MVLLTITAQIVGALQALGDSNDGLDLDLLNDTAQAPVVKYEELSLKDPEIGQPITHGQIIEIWKESMRRGHAEFTLEDMLRGATIYVPPRPPKPEPVRLTWIEHHYWPGWLTN
jgi:hypothetical protein